MNALQPEFLLTALLFPALIFAAVYDLKYRKIPNLLNFPLAGVALVTHTAFSGLDGLMFSGAGMLLGTALFLPPYIFGGMGAGDAKLMGAVGAVLGAKGVFFSALLTALYGGVYALLLLAVHRGYSRSFFSRIWGTFMSFVLTRQYIPASQTENPGQSPRLCYGLAIALGTATYVLFDIMGIDLTRV
ncbi:MAG: A24 family peptidase [Desulfovermiculus sp.]